ncbi:MAG: protein BatD [Bacteroidales bacterium]|nr:protein BatD [Bacteroidales bacterium]
MKRWFLIIWLTSILTSLIAQNVSFKASTQNVVSVGEQFQLTYELNTSGSRFRTGKFEGLRVLSGPNPSNSSSIQVINGQVSKSITQNFSYILLAEKEGKFTIPAAQIDVNGKIYTSNTVSVEVVKGSSNQNSNGSQNTDNSSDGFDNGDLYLSFSASKKNVYLGEPVAVTLKIYTKMDLADLQNPSFPEYKNFYSQDVDMPSNITLQRENVNGVIYNTALLNKVLLYPQKTGKLHIDPASIDAIIRKKVQRSGRRNVFDDFFGGGYQNFRASLKSNAIDINVKQLPGNAPEGFLGAVGDFSVSAQVDNTELSTNDALTYKLEIKGSGNIKLIKDPVIEFPHDFDVWDPTIQNNIKNTPTGTKGSKVFEYVVQPRHPGDFTIPVFTFSYFDLSEGKYKTLQTEAYPIHVSQGDNTTSAVANNVYSKEDVELIGQDIRYLKTAPVVLNLPSQPLLSESYFWLIYIVALLSFILVFWLKRKKIKEAADHVLVKNKKAKKIALSRLKQANTFLKSQEKEQFYEAVIKGLQGYLSDKLNISMAHFTLDAAVEKLNDRQIELSLIDQLKSIVQDCELARYAPMQANQTMEDVYKGSVQLISEFENKIKR